MTRVAGAWLDAPATRAVSGGADRGRAPGALRRRLRAQRAARAAGRRHRHRHRRAARGGDRARGGAGLDAVPTGIAHGTVTVVADGRPFEVTTFRRDVETDGRRATVAFTDELAEDAARRDFTMNALYAGPDGERGRSARRPRRPPRRPGALRRRPGAAHRGGLSAHPALLPLPRLVRRSGGRARPDGLAACAAAAGRARAALARAGRGGDREAARRRRPGTGGRGDGGDRHPGRVLPGADPPALAPLVHLEAAAGSRPAGSAGSRRSAGAPEWAAALRLSRADARALEATAAALAAGRAARRRPPTGTGSRPPATRR